MIYRDRNKLTIVDLQTGENKVSFNRLEEVILDNPSNIVYCERDGRLQGIITMGDIARADDKFVAFNDSFMFLTKDEYMQARVIFHIRPNINALPIVDKDGRLIGDCSRWDNLLYIKNVLKEQYPSQGICVAFVCPNVGFVEKQKYYNFYYENLISWGIRVQTINGNAILDHIDEVSFILFADEDQLRALDTLYAHIRCKKFDRSKLITAKNFIKKMMDEAAHESIRKYLENISGQGVHVLCLRFGYKSEYYSKLAKGIYERYGAIGQKPGPGVLYPELLPGFFDDLYTKEYADNFLHLNYSVETKSGSGGLKDFKSKYYNVTNGERVTLGQPQIYQKTVYFIGPCFIYGHYVEDKNTIESFLQKYINEADEYQIKIVNCGSLSYDRHIELEQARLMSTQLRRGDIVVCYADNEEFFGIETLDLLDVLKQNTIDEKWILDGPGHCNHKVNALYACAIYDALESLFSEDIENPREVIAQERDFVKLLYIDRYFSEFHAAIYESVGAIVMNCNPFTSGHRYLIEQALERVDFLIVFVVEEDKSIFTFDERITMVRYGVSGLNNVMVVPSGPFILSQTTFPEYFIKAADEDLKENVENDIVLFAEKIAPRLNIRYRFVGEEPEDAITNEYNAAMKRILPKNGIELVEIPRKQQDGKNITGSAVRKCLEDNDMQKLRKLVPESTIRVIFGS